MTGCNGDLWAAQAVGGVSSTTLRPALECREETSLVDPSEYRRQFLLGQRKRLLPSPAEGLQPVFHLGQKVIRLGPVQDPVVKAQ